MADFRNYNPARVILSFGEIAVQGYMDGTFIVAEREEDAFEKLVGAAGDVTRVRNNNRTGTVTVTLQQSAPTNDLLSAVARQDEEFGLGIRPLFLRDLNGTTLVQATNSWIQKLPAAEYADTLSGREWIFECAELTMNVGGSVV